MRQNRLRRIGLTGGMGAGKTTAARFLEEEGLLVVEADMVARDVLELYPEVHDYIRRTYGAEYFGPDGSLDRRAFARRIFSDPEGLKEYEAVIMPFIIEEVNERFDFIEDVTEDEWAVLEAPLLFEVKQPDICDVSVTVEMDRELQILRVMERDHLTRDEVKARLGRQLTREEREALADYVIVNDGSLPQLKEKILAVLTAIRQKEHDGTA